MTNINESTDPTTMLDGCADPDVARARALAIVGGYAASGDQEDAYWTEQAERVFAALLHAAALDEERTAHDVAEWLIDPAGLHDQVQTALARVDDPHMFVDGQQFLNTNGRTRNWLCMTILTAHARAALAAQVVNA